MVDVYKEFVKEKKYFYIDEIKNIKLFDKSTYYATTLDTKKYDNRINDKFKALNEGGALELSSGLLKAIINLNDKEGENRYRKFEIYTRIFLIWASQIANIKENIVGDKFTLLEYVKAVFNLISNGNIVLEKNDNEDFFIFKNNVLYLYHNYLLYEKREELIKFFESFDFFCENNDFFYKKHIKIFNVKTTSEYLNIIKEIKEEEESSSEIFYRGQINCNWDLLPSIFRNGIIEYEHLIYSECTSIMKNVFKSNNTYENLLYIQHNEGPTRLLDITNNALIALFFGCFDENNLCENNHGRVFIFTEKLKNIKYYDSDCVQLVANLSRMESNFKAKKYYLEKLIHCVRDYKPHFQETVENYHLNESYIVKGVMLNERIISQKGDFIIFGMGNEKKEPSKISQLNDVIILVKSENKKNILNELALFNITEGTVYPELNKKLKVIKNQWVVKSKKIEDENKMNKILQDIDLSAFELEELNFNKSN